MKVLKIIIGILLFALGLTMGVFAWLFFYEESEEIIFLKSLYVALLISAFVMALGITAIPFRKKENKMNKELEIIKQRLNIIRENTKVDNRRIADEENEECIKCIETCLSDIEKSLKTLEIIKNKKVNLEFLKCSENYEQYCLICSYGNEITKEEYDLLKEVLL